MFNKSILFLFICSACITTIFPQGRTGDPGVSFDGSTGLFLNPSAETLGAGHIQLGSTIAYPNQGQYINSRIPVTLSIGLTSRSELYYSTSSWYHKNLENEKNLSIGLRLNLFDFENLLFSSDFRWQNIELLHNKDLLYENQRLLSRALIKFSILNIKTFTNFGYISSFRKNDSQIDNRFIGGIGVLIPIVKRIHGIVDFQVDEHEGVNNNVIGSIGLKWYLFNHVQMASGYNYDVQGNESLNGVFINLSVSSEVMKGPRKKIRTRKGLPLPPKLPKEFYSDIDKDEFSKLNGSEESIIQSLPLSAYVEDFIKKDYINEYPMVPPIYQLDSWKNKLIDLLNEKNEITKEPVKTDLPMPPPLENIGISGYRKAIKQNPVNHEIIDESINVILPKPPPLDSIS